MVEKTNFGQKAAADQAKPKTIYETLNYVLILGRISDPKNEIPPELRIKYVVMGKEDGVLYTAVNGYGAAIQAIVTAQSEYDQAKAYLAEQEKAAKTDSDPLFGELN